MGTPWLELALLFANSGELRGLPPQEARSWLPSLCGKGFIMEDWEGRYSKLQGGLPFRLLFQRPSYPGWDPKGREMGVTVSGWGLTGCRVLPVRAGLRVPYCPGLNPGPGLGYLSSSV